MSSNLLAVPFRPVLNLKGTFESGARLTVYRANSTTLQPIYEDEARTVPLNNPLIADGYGAFPAIYYSDTQPVRVLIEDSTGTALFDVDPYIDNTFDSETILLQAAAQAFNAAASAADAEEYAENAAASEGVAQGLVGPSYASVAAGLAATTNGQFFAVVVGSTVSIYLNNAGSAVFQRDMLSATATTAALAGKADTSHTHVIADVTGLQGALDAKAPTASPAFTGTPTYQTHELGFRQIPIRSTTGTLVNGDRAHCVVLAEGITVPASLFVAGSAVSLYNDTASTLTVTQGAGLTLRLAGTTETGNRTLSPRAMATIWFRSTTEAIISGPGVS
jgi:hypothetical protein